MAQQNEYEFLRAFTPDPRFIKGKSHRHYIGGLWEQIGQLQFQFLLNRGLKASDYLLDIGCGSLRLGVKAIPYLDYGHYFGIDKEMGLISSGLRKEMSLELIRQKRPTFLISSGFEFEKLDRRPDFAIAHSLFTHLPQDQITLCFVKLRPILKDDGVFYASFHVSARVPAILKANGAHFSYTRKQICDFGTKNGFTARYIGGWNHPRRQVMAEYRKRVDSQKSAEQNADRVQHL